MRKQIFLCLGTIAIVFFWGISAKATQVRKGALLGGMPSERILIGKDHRDIACQLRRCVRKGDWLLFKGSRGMQMERVLRELKG
jgi:UDP-N-acetylmuramoyl-tripeptide--D-alanyl-D-alanine ligase